MHIVDATDSETPHVAAYLRVDNELFPVASYDHLLAPEDAILSFKGPLLNALYNMLEGKRPSIRQQRLIRSTLRDNPQYFHKLSSAVAATTSHAVLFYNTNVETKAVKGKRR